MFAAELASMACNKKDIDDLAAGKDLQPVKQPWLRFGPNDANDNRIFFINVLPFISEMGFDILEQKLSNILETEVTILYGGEDGTWTEDLPVDFAKLQIVLRHAEQTFDLSGIGMDYILRGNSAPKGTSTEHFNLLGLRQEKGGISLLNRNNTEPQDGRLMSVTGIFKPTTAPNSADLKAKLLRLISECSSIPPRVKPLFDIEVVEGL